MPLKVIIIEDDLTHRLNAEMLCEQLGHKVKGCFNNTYDALAQILRHRPDLLLVDIELDENTNGLILIEEVLQHYSPLILVTTSFTENDYIKQALKLGISQYLVKPLDINNLDANIKMALLKDSQQEKLKDALLLKTAMGSDRVLFEDIDFLETDGNRYCLIHAKNKTYRERTTLAALLQKLPCNDFIRVHKSFAFRFGALKSLHNNQKSITLLNGKVLPLGEKYKPLLMEKLK
ncbi:MAG: response regulator transcription factor [Bacteroidales bacterium]|nr:response regulator transcription factor [Bacteroidales bacterium]